VWAPFFSRWRFVEEGEQFLVSFFVPAHRAGAATLPPSSSAEKSLERRRREGAVSSKGLW
jgi:hypothetical protein